MATRGRGRHLLQAGRPGARRTALGTRRGRGQSGGAGPSWLGTARGGGGWGRYLLFGALRTRLAVFVFFLVKSPSKGSTEA